jgi:hypothetical protein
MRFGLSCLLATLIGCLIGTGSALAQPVQFEDVAQSSGIVHKHDNKFEIGGGAAFLDYNNDGYQDLFLTGGKRADRLYKNEGDGTFTDVTQQAGINNVPDSIVSTGVVAGDVNNDGYPELFVTTHQGYRDLFFQNNGDGTFTEVGLSRGFANKRFSVSAAFGDVNLDGHLDLFVCTYVDLDSLRFEYVGQQQDSVASFHHYCPQDMLYLNDGQGHFVRSMDSLMGTIAYDTACGLGAVMSDYDRDADPDILVANDFGQWIQPNRLWENRIPEGQGFVDRSAATNFDERLYGMGIAQGDYDADGDWDYYVTNIGANIFYENLGNATFQERAQALGIANTWDDPMGPGNDSLQTTGWGAALKDIDNDRDLDLWVVNGFINMAKVNVTKSDTDRLFLNTGGSFTEVGQTAGMDSADIGRGLAAADYDRDGDLDFVVVKDSSQFDNTHTNYTSLFQNQTQNNNHWLQIDLRGLEANRDGIGATVHCYENGHLMREVYSGGSHASQHSLVAHFGLGTNVDGGRVDSVKVVWPGGRTQVEQNLAVDSLHTIVEDTSATDTPPPTRRPAPQSAALRMGLVPNPAHQHVALRYALPKAGPVQLQVLDQQGRIVRQHHLGRRSAGAHQHRMQLGGLAPGLYAVRLVAGTRVRAARLMVR